MKKKAILMVAAVLSVFPATAQIQDKLNFEVPLFGVSMKNVKPQWSLVLFGELNLGYSYAFQVPEQYLTLDYTTATGEVSYTEKMPSGLRPSGFYGDISIMEVRLRPWRDGNMFALGLTFGTDSRNLHKGALFGPDYQPVQTLSGRMGQYALGTYSENAWSLSVGYFREFGDWSMGIQMLPGFGYAVYTNRTQGGHVDRSRTGSGFRLGTKVSAWYRHFGAFVSCRPSLTGPRPYTTLSAGLSIRY